MKVMTLNLGGGAVRRPPPNLEPMYRSARPVIAELAALVESRGIDVLALQEVPVNHPWHDRQDGPALLRQALAGSLPHSRHMQYPKKKRLALMVLSRLRIRRYVAGRHRLSPSQTFVVKRGRRRYRLFNYHGDVHRPDEALRRFRRFIRQHYRAGACALVGDFNLRAESAELASLGPRFKDACTEVGGGDCHKTVNPEIHAPRRGPDFIWSAGWSPVAVRSLPEFSRSDHLPVMAELRE